MFKKESSKTVKSISKKISAKVVSSEASSSASDTAFRELAREFAKIEEAKIEFFLGYKNYKTEIDLKIEAFYSQYDLSSGRFQILMILRCTDGFAMSASALADKARVSRASMTQFLDALEKSGYITREDFPGDRRAVLIKISPWGLQILNKKLLPIYFKRCAKFSAKCTHAEMKNFRTMYEKISQNLTEFDKK